MDVHRCRFVPYPPAAINALAFSHTSGTAGRNQPLRLAIGRANGDIEIWDPRKGAWVHEVTFRGGKGRSVEGLCWTQDPDEEDETEIDGKKFVTHGRLRLFSIGYSSAVTEWDMHTGLPLRESGGSLSEVWCIAAQPRWSAKTGETVSEDSKHQNLVAGCADGTLVLLSTTDSSLTFSRYIARPTKKNARTLSLAFQNRHTLVAGFADSSIRVYDIRNGNLIRNMSLGGGPAGGPKDKLVWALDCLRDGTIVSGDSAGEVVFWDGKTYGQLQRLKGHEADILCLASSEDGSTVFSGGMDRRTVVYSAQQQQGAQRKRWAEKAHRRFHQHDVKAMARFDSAGMSVVVSGGLDTHPVLIPLREFGSEHHHALPYVPQTAPVASGAGRCVVGWWGNQITIWRIARRKQQASAPGGFMDASTTPNHRVVAQLALNGDESVACAAMSPCGALLAVATVAETKLFHLQPRRSGAQKGTLKVKKLETPKSFSATGAKIVQFSPDGRWVQLISHSNIITLVRIIPAPTSADGKTFTLPPQLLQPSTHLARRHVAPRVQNCLNGPWGSYERTITRAAFSADGRVLAVSDLGGNVETWVLEGNEDLSAPAVDVAVRSTRSSSPRSNSGSETSDSEDEEAGQHRGRNKKIVVYHGQHWAINPTQHLLPRLPTAPIILSFRPQSSSATPAISNNPGIHATRANPHAHSHVPPSPSTTDARLFVLTSTHEPYELDVLRGGMTEWGKKHTGAKALPEQVRLQRDRAVGVVWDIRSPSADREGWERLWLHGAGWLGMLDLSSPPAAEPGTEPTDAQASAAGNKRKHSADPTTEPAPPQHAKKPRTSSTKQERKESEAIRASLALQKCTTGAAGSRIADATTGIKVLKGETWVDGARKQPPRSEDEDDGEEPSEDSESDAVMSADGAANGVVALVGALPRRKRFQRSHWLTNRYRPVLALVPVAAGASAAAAAFDAALELGGDGVGGNVEGDEGGVGGVAGDVRRGRGMDAGVLEVALIERPLWDLDLPARVAGVRD